MKIRNGFVSNSSSSSFIINPAKISEDDLEKIKDYLLHGSDEDGEIGYDKAGEYFDYWSCHYDENMGLYRGSTCMDNEYFSNWLVKNGLDKYVSFEGDNW